MTTLLIARHGNTFDPGDQVVRVGAGTDLPLSSSGEQQAKKLGVFLRAQHPIIDCVYSSCLQRTYQTAALALDTAGIESEINQAEEFNEIDYGPDEAQPEASVVARIGTEALVAWDTAAVPPPGWCVDPQQRINDWQQFAEQMCQQFPDGTVLVVTSNGMARFVPHLSGDFEGFKKKHNLKMATGAVSCLKYQSDGYWYVDYWNYRS